MAWHRIEHRATGSIQIVASLAGVDLGEWAAVRVKAGRAPGEFQTVLPDGSTVTDNTRPPPPPSTDELLVRLEAVESAIRGM